MDVINKEQRSRNMSLIRAKDTKPEILLRRVLFRVGYRYRIHVQKLAGKPDIVFPKYKTVIFVHGCFWHLHKGCKGGHFPKSRLEYWKPKLLTNVKRDKIHQTKLLSDGWKIIVIWECEINANIDLVLKNIQKKLPSNVVASKPSPRITSPSLRTKA